MGDGGTRMYCPDCREIQDCKSIKPAGEWTGVVTGYCYDAHGVGMHQGGNFREDGLVYFRRYRECQECLEEFATGEIDEGIIRNYLRLTYHVRKMKELLDQGPADLVTSVEQIKALIELVKTTIEIVE